MTAIVGILCSNGVVIGTDSAVTFGPTPGFRTMEQCTEKLEVIHEQIIITGTGAVGLNQRFCDLVTRCFDKGVFNKPPIEACKIISRYMLEDMNYTFLKPGQYGALVAFSFQNTPYLCEFGQSDFQPELKDKRIWYCSMGSTVYITDPFLGFIRSIFWQKGPPTVREATFVVTWTLQHAVEVNPGGVNLPIRIAVLEHISSTEIRARKLEEAELLEHFQSIDEAKRILSEFRDRQQLEKVQDVPDVPRP